MAELIRMVGRYFGMTKTELGHALEDADLSSLGLAVAKLVSKSTEGDISAFHYLMELMVGKIPENDYDEFSEDDLAILNRIKAAMAEQTDDHAESSH